MRCLRVGVSGAVKLGRSGLTGEGVHVGFRALGVRKDGSVAGIDDVG